MGELKIKNLKKQYGKTVVIDGLNLSVHEGELLSLLGPSGCGKTTTLRMVAGLAKPTGGSIQLNGKEISKVPPHKRNVGLVFQNYALFPHLTIFDNVAYGLKRHKVPKSDIKERVNEILKTVQLTGYEDRFPHQLSGGQQQRVALARTLVLRPPIVLFDEPLSNLDAKLRQTLRIEIRELQQKLKFTAIFVTHDQEEAMVLSDRIAVMNNGKIEQLSAPHDIYMKPENEFVADFVGESNFIEIQQVKDQGDRLIMTTKSGHTIQSPHKKDNARTVMIRPEMISFTQKDEAESRNRNQISGRVLFIQYSGTSYLIGVQVDGLEEPILVRSNYEKTGKIDFAEGENIKIEWDYDSTYVF